ncbi:MAG: RteC domain-containing protein [Flavobacteriia bacterium]|nr:RteC domain-containing protein [Flavobacteriia bacterium]
MENSDLNAIFEELRRSEVSFVEKGDSLDNGVYQLFEADTRGVSFNGFDSLSEYFQHLLNLYSRFKAALSDALVSGSKKVKRTIRYIKGLICELQILLNPKNEDLLLARVEVKSTSDSSCRPESITGSIMKFIDAQREALRLVKSHVKSIKDTKWPYVSVMPPDTQLSGMSESSMLVWKRSKSELIELIASLHELKAFGENVTRKQLWDFFSSAFGVTLNNAEKSLHQMKYRKLGNAKFLSRLVQKFDEMMDPNSDLHKSA